MKLEGYVWEGKGIFKELFIKKQQQGLEQFITKIAGHPLAHNEKCLHMFTGHVHGHEFRLVSVYIQNIFILDLGIFL